MRNVQTTPRSGREAAIRFYRTSPHACASTDGLGPILSQTRLHAALQPRFAPRDQPQTFTVRVRNHPRDDPLGEDPLWGDIALMKTFGTSSRPLETTLSTIFLYFQHHHSQVLL